MYLEYVTTETLFLFTSPEVEYIRLTPDMQLVHRLERLIEVDFRQHKNRLFYARKLEISISSLDKLARAHLGKSVYELIQDRVHEEAKRLLRGSGISIKEITYELGISDQAYFCRCFKKITGLTPRGYRRLGVVSR
jgi:AraC-like DNA-binding protein